VPSLPLLGLCLRLTSLLPPSLPLFPPNQPTCAAANTPRARWPSHFIQLRQPEFQHRLSRRAMLYRMRGSTFRTLSVCNEFPPLVVTISTCHIFAALSILNLSTSLSRLLQASLVIVRVRMLEIPAAVLLQEQRRSPALRATPPPSRKPQPNLAHHHGDMPNGKKASRPRDRISAIPTAAPFVVGLARGVGQAERSSAALILRHDQSEGCLLGCATPSLLLDHLPLLLFPNPFLARSF